MKLLGLILKQKRIPGLGALVDALYTATPLFSMVNFISVLVLLYTAIQEKWAPWLSLFTFFILVAAGTLLVILVVYKFLIPSLWDFRSKQMGDLYSMVDEMYKEFKKNGKV